MESIVLKKSDDSTKSTHPITVLLVDDQLIIAEAVRRMLADEADVVFHYCQDPTQAITMATKIQPTVILQDLVMPEIDGLLLLKYFRVNSATKDVPMIVLSAKEEPIVKANAFALGANDYLVKLPDKIELIARIRYHSTAYTRLLERNEAYEKLASSQKALQSELNEAATYVRSTLPEPMAGKVSTSWVFEPSTVLGGDAFGYQWLDEDNFAFYLLDVCGHGVGAALLSISVTNLLRTYTLPNADFYAPASVLNSLNENFQMENHNNMFFTMWYGVYKCSTREITYSNGGHPPPILMTGSSAETAEVHELKLPGLIVGGMPNVKFDQAKAAVGAYNRFYLFSDGVYEIAKPDATMLSYEELEAFIKNLPSETEKDQDVKSIVGFGKSFIGDKPFKDDFSILKIIFG